MALNAVERSGHLRVKPVSFDLFHQRCSIDIEKFGSLGLIVAGQHESLSQQILLEPIE